MRITNVMRGEEWMPSLPKHVLLYQALQWEMPTFTHLPLLIQADGSKLSKRQQHASVQDYVDKHYLPEAIVNFVALLGWNPKTTKELFSMDELIGAFSLGGINKAPAVVDLNRLGWMNKQHLHARIDQAPSTLTTALRECVHDTLKLQVDDNVYLEQVLRLSKERIQTIQDITERFPFLFRDYPVQSSPLSAEHKQVIIHSIQAFQPIEQWTHEDLQAALPIIQQQAGVKPSVVYQALRHAVMGTPIGPHVLPTLQLLTKSTVLDRLAQCI
jgi:glutamyl/glutaminyl-tRNA synthetase